MIRVDEPFLPINHPFRRTYNLKQVLAKYNHPERKLKTYSVVGTNGKGSTSFYLSQVLQQTHPKVGLFVSPAFQYQNERIQINDQPISDDDLRYYRDLIAQDIIDYDLTFFEI
jgi:dihydrofolate synthase/folylpolyglutamate synthase